MLAGETDFLLKIVAADWDAYQEFLTTKLTATPNINHVRSSLSIRAAKTEPGVPIDLAVPGDELEEGDNSGDAEEAEPG